MTECDRCQIRSCRILELEGTCEIIWSDLFISYFDSEGHWPEITQLVKGSGTLTTT